MRSLVAPVYGPPSKYTIASRPLPQLTSSSDVLIRVHAAAITTGDTQFAAGYARLLVSTPLPLPLGIEGSGTVIAAGSVATSKYNFRPGDAVYGLNFQHGQFPPPSVGFASEYAVVPADVLLHKPGDLSFEDAAVLLGAAVTIYQCMKRYFELVGPGQGDVKTGTLEGKTVFVPGPLGAFGSVAAQVARNVFGAQRVVATVSTAKKEMRLVERYLPGVVDELVDYQTEDVVKVVGRGKVDLVLNTQWDMVGTFPLANPRTGAVVSIASVPSAETVRKMLGESKLPFPFRHLVIWAVTLAYMWYDWKLRGTNIKQDFVSGNPGNREDLEAAGEWVATGKIRAVKTVVSFDDIEAVRDGCKKVVTGKGGIGKLVIKMI